MLGVSLVEVRGREEEEGLGMFGFDVEKVCDDGCKRFIMVWDYVCCGYIICLNLDSLYVE